MKLLVTISSILLTSMAFALAKWVSGYLIYPLISGLISMASVIAAMLMVAGAVIYLGFGRKLALRQRAAVLAGTFAIAILPFAMPYELLGFEFRVRQTSQPEWLEIADDARSLILAASGNGQLPRGPIHDWNREYVKQLAGSHPVLAAGDYTPKLFVAPDCVGIYWGSGIVGTLAVEISSSPEVLASDGFFQRRRIDDHIALVWE